MSEPSDIKNLLMGLAEKWGLKEPASVAKLFSEWEQIVGPQVAAKCRPVTLKDGILRLSTDSPAWAGELRYLAPQIRQRVNEALGKPLVDEVRAAVSRPSRGGRKSGI